MSQPLCEVSTSPSPVLTSPNELELLHEKRCSQPHYCDYLYARCQECGACKGGRHRERESERARRRGGGNTAGFGYDRETRRRPARTEPRGTSTERSRRFTYSPSLPPPVRSDLVENGAPGRRRARLCGGGHRKEAHPQGNRGRDVHVEITRLTGASQTFLLPHHHRARSSTWSSGEAGPRSKSR